MKALITFTRYVTTQAPFLGSDAVPSAPPPGLLDDNQFSINGLREPPKRLGVSFKGPVGAVPVDVEVYFYEELTAAWYVFTTLPVTAQTVTFFEVPSLVSSPLRVRGNTDAYGGPVTCEVRPLTGGLDPAGQYDFIVFYDYSTYTIPTASGGGGGGPATDVNVLSSTLPLGAATESSLAAINTKVPSLGQAVMASSTPVVIASDQPALTVTVDNFPGTQVVSGTVSVDNFPATQAVQAATWPLPSGAATEAKQDTQITAEQAIQTAVETVATATASLATTALQQTGNESLSNLELQLPPARGPQLEADSLSVTVVSQVAAPDAPTETTLSAVQTDTGAINTATTNIDSKTPDLGQATMTGSTPVVIASNQSPVGVTGPLTDTQLRATAVPVSGTVAVTGVSTAANQTTSNGYLATIATATDVALSVVRDAVNAVRDRLPAAFGAGGGVKVDGSGTALPISGTVTANAGTGTFAVSGPLTDVQLRATAVPVSGTVAVTGVATSANQTAGNASLSSIDGKVPANLTVNSTRLLVDPSGVTQPVSGTVTANIGTSGSLALDNTLTGGTAKAIVRGAALGATAAKDATVSGIDTDHNALDVAIQSLPGSPAQEHTTAVSPNAARLTDGASFYVAAKSGDNMGADLRVASTAVSNANPVPTVYQNFATFSVLALGTALGNGKSLISIFLASGGAVTKLRLLDVQVLSTQPTNVTGVMVDLQLRRITAHSAGTAITNLVTKYDTADTLDANITVRTGATVTSEANPLRKWYLSTDEYTVGATETESFQASLENMFPSYPFDPRMRPLVARVNEGFQILCNTNTTLGTFDVGFIFAQE